MGRWNLDWVGPMDAGWAGPNGLLLDRAGPSGTGWADVVYSGRPRALSVQPEKKDEPTRLVPRGKPKEGSRFGWLCGCTRPKDVAGRGGAVLARRRAGSGRRAG
ncbi:hypothetical protein CDL15_Pgr015104 [Punica granatum]|uniref:Uncharacterized protein n=1 Tax=Punica granatum TaxID=22663 RepID=A0A218WD22_PUNGR|nr:hypothetical protein CDL15_Pgr015104 [Punica granatum]